MKIVSVREMRSKSAKIWQELPQEKDIVITSNGKPVGILSAATSENLEQSLAAMRRARAELALTQMQTRSVKSGRDKISLAEINREIAAVRKNRPK